MASNADYSILAKVVLDLGGIQRQLNNASKGVKFNIDSGGVATATTQMNELGDATDKAGTAAVSAYSNWYQYYMVLQQVINVVESLAEQTFTLDASMTEFKKVSDLTGSALDRYVEKLTEMGKAVARTGKPNRSEPE